MSTLVIADMPAVVAMFADHPRTLITKAVEECCANLGLKSEQRRQSVFYALSFYPLHSVAWCVSQGTKRAREFAGSVSYFSTPKGVA